MECNSSLWFEIPHFSAVGLEVNAETETTDSSGTSGESTTSPTDDEDADEEEAEWTPIPALVVLVVLAGEAFFVYLRRAEQETESQFFDGSDSP